MAVTIFDKFEKVPVTIFKVPMTYFGKLRIRLSEKNRSGIKKKTASESLKILSSNFFFLNDLPPDIYDK